MDLDDDACYRALITRDARFDGRLFVAVRTTGIYCRPICPARTPKRENVTFYPTASAAQEAGYRPCLRCRPESSPDLAAWRGTSNTVSRALALIGEGALDSEPVDTLAERLGVGERQLRRLFKQHLGASPIAVAQTRRVLFAKQLIVETQMPLAEVALASGFGSIRRFNATFHALYNRPPRELRRGSMRDVDRSAAAGITLNLPYAPPYDWDVMIGFLAARAITGIECVEGVTRYLRTVALDGVQGTVSIEPNDRGNGLRVRIRFPRVEADPRADLLAVEEPLEIRLNGSPLTVTMRTPGDDIDLAAGFLAAEGVVASPGDIAGIRMCAENVADVTLADDAAVAAASLRRSFLTTSACGVCGKDSIAAIQVRARYDVSADPMHVSPTVLATLPGRLREAQRVFASTGGLHAAGLFTAEGTLLALREDIGRHNAVDKVVGLALRDGHLPLAGRVLVVSGRASFELAQKALVAGIPLLAAVSAPSSLAVELAEQSGMTLVGFLRGTTMNVYTGAHRLPR